MIRNMTFNQKKAVTLFLAVAIVAMLSMLTGCSSKAEQEKQQQEKAQQEAMKKFMHQGDGTVRKPGQNGAKQF